MFVCIVLIMLHAIQQNSKHTSQVPIFKTVPGKLEALSLESAAAEAAEAAEAL